MNNGYYFGPPGGFGNGAWGQPYQQQQPNFSQSSSSQPRIAAAAQKTCYYELLGINKTADEADIKKAYRKQSLLWHPDKNPTRKDEAEERFKQLSEAYQILIDAEKRAIYDRYGFDDPSVTFNQHQYQGGNTWQPISPFELFSSFFSNDPFFGDLQSPFGNMGPFASPMFSNPFFSDPFRAQSFMHNQICTPFSGSILGAHGFGFPMNPNFNSSQNSHFSSGSSSYTSSSTTYSGNTKVKTTTTVKNGKTTTYIETTDAQGNVSVEVYEQ